MRDSHLGATRKTTLFSLAKTSTQITGCVSFRTLLIHRHTSRTRQASGFGLLFWFSSSPLLIRFLQQPNRQRSYSIRQRIHPRQHTFIRSHWERKSFLFCVEKPYIQLSFQTLAEFRIEKAFATRPWSTRFFRRRTIPLFFNDESFQKVISGISTSTLARCNGRFLVAVQK